MRGPTPRRKKEFSGRLNQRARDVEPSHQWPSPQSGEPATNPQPAPRTHTRPFLSKCTIPDRGVVDYDQVQPFPGLATCVARLRIRRDLKQGGSELHVQGK